MNVSLFNCLEANVISFIMLGFVYLFARRRLDRTVKLNRLFLLIASLLLFQVFIDTLTSGLNHVPLPWLVPVMEFCYTLIYVVGTLITYLWFYFCYQWIHPGQSLSDRKNRMLLVPMALYCAFMASNLFTGAVFAVTSSNVYHRGPWFFLSILLSYFYLLLSLILIFRSRKTLMKQVYVPLLLFGLLPAAGAAVQAAYYGILLMWSSSAFSLVVVFIYIQQRMMQRDVLTGGWTKSSFEHYIEQILARCGTQNFGLIFIDLDNFKKINDQYGHLEGDCALKTAVNLIRVSLRQTDIVARFGGDEFVVLLHNIDRKGLEKTALRIGDSFQQYNESSQKQYRLEYSYGCDVYDPLKYSVWEFLNYVDHLMYESKTGKKSKADPHGPAARKSAEGL